jgi:hypothetical protein
MSNASPTLRDRLSLDRETLLVAALVLNTELILLGAYAVVTDSFSTPTLILLPWVWINVALVAILKTRPAPAPTGRKRLAAAIAVGYLLILGYFGGLWGLSQGPGVGFRMAIFSIPPGWSPALLYSGDLLALSILPYKLVGYLALAWLVYATVIDAAGSAVTGVLGLLSCVSCSWPILASLLTGIGGGGALAAAAQSQSYELSTVVFVVTVALLYWRPFGTGKA